jgi:hypothetical protein
MCAVRRCRCPTISSADRSRSACPSAAAPAGAAAAAARARAQLHILEFGQTPTQLFASAHAARAGCASTPSQSLPLARAAARTHGGSSRGGADDGAGALTPCDAEPVREVCCSGAPRALRRVNRATMRDWDRFEHTGGRRSGRGHRWPAAL